MADLATSMALLRGLHLAAGLSLLGTAGFIAWVLPAAGGVPDWLGHRLARLCWASGLIAVAAGLAWFVTQAAVIADASDFSEALQALPAVAAHTRYGNMLMIRLGLLLAAMLPLVGVALADGTMASGAMADGGRTATSARTRVHLILLLSAVALGLQGFIGHAGATAGAIGDGLVVSEALHLLAAGLWLGALIPLWLSLGMLSLEQSAVVCERFSPIGLGCVLVLAGTGCVQGLQLIGSLPALLGTAYGHIALLKIALFLAALALAGVNRLWLTDHLGARASGARRHLMISVSVETVCGFAIVAAAGFLASAVPAEHAVVVWPFGWQFSLITINEDVELRREVILSLLLMGGALVLVVAAMWWHRFRLATLAILAATVVARGGSLTLLTTEAFPTSFQTSTTGFTAQSIVRGQTLFAGDCVACHGPDAEGDGPAAAGLRIKPADLTMAHILEHSDGEMFWFLSHGIDDPEGGLAMPGFGAALSADDRWALIDYVRAHNIGVATQRDSAFGVALRAPGFAVICNGLAASTTADLRGRALHVVIGEAATGQPPVPRGAGIAVVNVAVASGETTNTQPEPGACMAVDPSAWRAYSVLADLPPEQMAGTEFLIDPEGWLRAVQRPGTTGGWHSAGNLLAAIRGISTHPLEGGQHDHHR